MREKAVLLNVKSLTVQMVDACLSDRELIKKFCMVNPPERRGISAQVFLLYPFCAGSGADTELTGRHPAPCSIQRLGIHPGSSLQEPFYMQKNRSREERLARNK